MSPRTALQGCPTEAERQWIEWIAERHPSRYCGRGVEILEALMQIVFG